MTADYTSEHDTPRVTVAVMPREKFCCVAVSLRSLLEHTKVPFELLYIDAGSPPAVQTKIDELLAAREHTLHRVDNYLAPFAANAIAIEQAATEYLVMVDNDVYLHPGWLEALVRCADEEQADVVSPLILIGDQHSSKIHVAGGRTSIVTDDGGRRRITHEQFYEFRQLDDPDVQVHRQRTERVETHTVLARLETWRALGPLDPEIGHITNVDELSLLLVELAASVWFEPEARVVYLFGTELRMGREDIRLMGHVWSEQWIVRDLDAINARRGLHPDDDRVRQARWWFGEHRRVWLALTQQRVRRAFDVLHVPWAGNWLWKAVEKTESAANRARHKA